MPQLSLYIDEKTLRKLEMAAKIEHLSISKYTVKKLRESMQTAWPDHYEDLFGSLDDPSFEIHRTSDFEGDNVRESL